jgi:tagaturonate reductase
MMLNKKTYASTTTENVEALFALPEKVLQFGTGVLLRGLPDYFIDKANKQGLFNGRIVVVKSTDQGDTDAYETQDGLYSILEKGIENGTPIERTTINASISRVVSAKSAWQDVLACAASKDIQVIISNTTEVGITLVPSDATAAFPASFPGKLLHFLMERYHVFNGSNEFGLVIIPTELISDNGTQLKEIVLALAQLKGLDAAFIDWVHNANDFCSSLVDCIVPGTLPASEKVLFEQKAGYSDALAIMSEPYRLWAIETASEKTANILSFAGADARVILASSINKYKEIKLRLLNATHSLCCGVAHLSGFVTVRDALKENNFRSFISVMLLDEIVPLVADGDISLQEANTFALQVIDRFSNQSIEHLWLNISVQYTSKMQMRVVPLIEKYVEQNGKAPMLMSFGFAAFLIFMKSKAAPNQKYMGTYAGTDYEIKDDKAAEMSNAWASKTTFIPSSIFNEQVFAYIDKIDASSVTEILATIVKNK